MPHTVRYHLQGALRLPLSAAAISRRGRNLPPQAGSEVIRKPHGASHVLFGAGRCANLAAARPRRTDHVEITPGHKGPQREGRKRRVYWGAVTSQGTGMSPGHRMTAPHRHTGIAVRETWLCSVSHLLQRGRQPPPAPRATLTSRLTGPGAGPIRELCSVLTRKQGAQCRADSGQDWGARGHLLELGRAPRPRATLEEGVEADSRAIGTEPFQTLNSTIPFPRAQTPEGTGRCPLAPRSAPQTSQDTAWSPDPEAMSCSRRPGISRFATITTP